MKAQWNRGISMMKNIIAILILFALLISLFSCSKNGVAVSISPTPNETSNISSLLTPQADTDKNTESSVLSPSVVSPQPENITPADVSIPPFQGTVARGGLPLLGIPNSAWEQAKHDFEMANPAAPYLAENITLSDFTVSTLTDNWQGSLGNEPFSLNVYYLEKMDSQCMLVVSKYGNNSVKIAFNTVSGFRTVFAFYGSNVWIIHEAKGIGESFNLITGEWENAPLEQFENLITEFGQLFVDLSSIETEARQTGAELKLDGYSLRIVDGLVVEVTDQ